MTFEPPDLTPTARDRLRTVVADPSCAWASLHWLAEVGSTNDEVVHRVRRGAPVGTVVAADRQTAGRGRRGRVWEDRAGASLLLSAGTAMPSRGGTLVPLAAGLAVADAVARQGLEPRLKWPNDVLVGDRKVAGVLVEAHHLPDEPGGGARRDPASRPRVVVVGMGTNVDWRRVTRAAGATWTSLAEERDGDVDRWLVAADLLVALDARLAGVSGEPVRLLADYRTRCATLGADVHVTLPDRSVRGHAVDVDDAGGLVVATAAGREVVVAGDVTHVRAG